MPKRVHSSRRIRFRAVWAILLPTAVAGGSLAASPPADDGPAPSPAPTTVPAAQPDVPGVASAAQPVVGFAINAHHIGDLSLYLDSVDRIADLGANALLVVTPMFQERVDSTQIRFRPTLCPTDDQLIAILTRAHRRGLRTTLLPIVLIERPQEKDWRGVLRPSDPDAWWESYDRFIDRYVEIAIAADVDLFSVGSELNAMEDALDRWRDIVDRVRQRLSCPLTYTANWDRYDKVSFWSLLDVISISAYFELVRDDPDASVERLAEAWSRQRDILVRFARRHDRPFLLMELGYPSLPWAAAHPWNYVASAGTTADPRAQARAYRAFFRAWADTFALPSPVSSGAMGFHCYYWDPYHHGGPTDTGYGIDGKPALRVIKKAFQQIQHAAKSPQNRNDRPERTAPRIAR